MTLQFCSCDISAILTPVINCTLLIWPPLCTSSCLGHNFYKHHSSYCKFYRKNQTNKAILGEKKCILMLILLEINAFIKIKIQLSYLARLGILFLSNIFLRLVVVTDFFFFWHGHFSYLLDSRRADICRVAGGKAEIKADFHLIFPKYNCIIK